MATNSNPVGSSGATPESELFLSPAWIGTVVEAVEEAKQRDSYLGSLVSKVNLTVVYTIRKLPGRLRKWYGNKSQAILTVRLCSGAVEEFGCVGEVPKDLRYQLTITTDYDTARRLLIGELSPASTLVNRGVVAEPAKDYKQWSALAPRALVLASRLLRTARKLPTRFP